jgi:hypothetical protein
MNIFKCINNTLSKIEDQLMQKLNYEQSTKIFGTKNIVVNTLVRSPYVTNVSIGTFSSCADVVSNLDHTPQRFDEIKWPIGVIITKTDMADARSVYSNVQVYHLYCDLDNMTFIKLKFPKLQMTKKIYCVRPWFNEKLKLMNVKN